MYLYRGHSARKSLDKGEGIDKKATENDIERRPCSQKSDALHTICSMYFFSVTQSFLLRFP